ncbi:hypothetical protein [Paractinoplanes hotanensis]|uniref:Uncharacterized protein n=1 Tax=Paractinoplanes hotanensis TaxID=2906497 RepID=A0ABT0YEV6_9ACTN|nr:hypothetical protein [Actinoplanes hotanensis]MCM4084583.1 hypothetical protein [Actinoplanes hotanensis]
MNAEVLGQITWGRTNGEIAAALFVAGPRAGHTSATRSAILSGGGIQAASYAIKQGLTRREVTTMDDAPDDEPDADETTYEVDGDTIMSDASLESDVDEPGSSEWRRDED